MTIILQKTIMINVKLYICLFIIIIIIIIVNS